MRYLENFENYFADEIQIFELLDSDFLDLISEGTYKESLIKCPCDQTKGWVPGKSNPRNIGKKDYKYCCSKWDKRYVENLLSKNLYTKFTQVTIGSEPKTIGWYESLNPKSTVTIKPTHHWFERLYRKSDQKYVNIDTIYNPTIDEAVEIIIKNIDKIINKLVSFRKTKFTLELLKNNAVTKNGLIVPYSVIVAVNYLDYATWELSLVTHIKGERLYTQPYREVTKMVADNFKFSSK